MDESTTNLPQDFTEPVPDVPPINQLPPPPLQKHFLQNRKSKIFGFLVFVLTAGLAVYVLAKQPAVQRIAIKNFPILYPSPVASPSPVPTKLPEPSASPSSILANSSDPDKRIVFWKLADLKKIAVDGWIMNPDGSKQESLVIPSLRYAYKRPQSSLLFYDTFPDTDSVFVKNLNTEQITQIKPIQFPDQKIDVGIAIPDVDSISPDGNYFLFDARFSIECPPGPDGKPTVHDGPGCEPEVNPDFPQGLYLYDLKTQKSTPLNMGDSLRISDWDLDHKKIVFMNLAFNAGGLDELDLTTHQIKRIDNATSFGYGVYEIPNSNKLVVINATTGDSGTASSSSSIAIKDLVTKQSSEFDHGIWAEIQPFAAITPDQKYVLYERTKHYSDGQAISSIHRYVMATGETSQLTPDTTQESYSVRGLWTDNQNYVTMVNTLETPYTNINNFLVSINVATGKITRLTAKDDVYRFTLN